MDRGERKNERKYDSLIKEHYNQMGVLMAEKNQGRVEKNQPISASLQRKQCEELLFAQTFCYECRIKLDSIIVSRTQHPALPLPPPYTHTHKHTHPTHTINSRQVPVKCLEEHKRGEKHRRRVFDLEKREHPPPQQICHVCNQWFANDTELEKHVNNNLHKRVRVLSLS